MSITAKITKKGQVTIPQNIRKRLNSQVIEFDIVENNVMIRPVKSVAGSLNSYARKRAPSFKEGRERAWEEAIEDRYGKKTGRR
jgi:AbrB family looped-hinge helix DNA binding protein